MYRLFKVLFDTLKLPELRAKRGEVVSYSKQLLVSRIIYFCRLTANESFTVDSSSLKGVLKQYGNTDFNQLEPRFIRAACDYRKKRVSKSGCILLPK